MKFNGIFITTEIFLRFIFFSLVFTGEVEGRLQIMQSI